jgi:hypothetical protein
MKQPSWKTPIILVATLAAVGGFTYWLQVKHKPKQEQADSLVKKPLGVPTTDTQIAAFKIKSVRGLIEGKCDDLAQKKCKVNEESNWTLTYPQTLAADPETIKSFINDAANVLATETIDLSEETPEKRAQLLDEYGLSPNKRTDLNMQFIELVLENGKRLTAWFGQEHPLGDKTFVVRAEDGVVNDKTVFLISNFFKSNFDKPLTFFRAKKMFAFDRGQIDAFEAKTSSGKLTGTLTNGSWNLNGFNGDYERIETVLAAISQLKAIEFPEASVIKGLKPIVTYDLKEKDKHYTLALYEKTVMTKSRAHFEEDEHDHDHGDHDDDDGDREPGSVKAKKAKQDDRVEEKHYFAVASGHPEVVEVQALIRSQIDKSVSDLRNGILLSQAEKVTTTHFKIEGKAYPEAAVFEFKSGSWTSSSKLDGNNIPKFFDILTRERVKDFVAVPTAAHDQELTLSLGDDKNPTKSHYLFFLTKKGKEEQAYAIDLNSKNKEAMLLDAAIYKNALPFTPDSWKLSK